MDIPQSDAFVFFGTTGDLAFRGITSIDTGGEFKTPSPVGCFTMALPMKRVSWSEPQSETCASSHADDPATTPPHAVD